MRESVCTILFWGIGAVYLTALLYPWRFETKSQRTMVHLPLVTVPMLAAYEICMPDEINIRVDLLFLLPMMLAGGLLYLGKLVAMDRARRRGSKQNE